jgi:hypothetical protein
MLQRTWVPIIAEAIRLRDAEGRDGDYEINGAEFGADGVFCVLVSERSDDLYDIGLYLPASAHEGTCDYYTICKNDGEEVETLPRFGDMSQTETEDFIVKYKDDPATKEAVFEMVVKFFIEHEVFSGDSIMQCDAPQIDGPELLCELAERIGFDAKVKEE